MQTEEYHLSIDVDFAHLTFRGKVRIVGELDAPTLRLNSVGLEIQAARAGVHALSVKPLVESEEIELSGLPAGSRDIEVDYTGKIPEQSLLGLYRSVQPPDYIVATQFEATGARRVFPCADRPDQKATYDVEVRVDPGLTVLFNTPVAETGTIDGRQRLRFVRTPRMSTYLMFLAIGKFDVLRGTGPGSRVAVWTPPGDAVKGTHALGVAQRVLKEFEVYYDIPYPLPKLDLISIREFGAGAMENWGAISYRERFLLVDETTPSNVKRAVSTVTAHEIAHQWFGDLVTMRWWDDIWLNESFASFMAFKVMDRLGDIPDVWSDFLLTETSLALLGDSLTSTHPIRQAVESPEEIDQIFDEISYGKGASVLRMLEGFLGAEAFRRGVHDYLVKFQYGNARGEDLWLALEASAHQPVADLMRRWVERPGLPVIIVHRGTDGLHLEQRRFSLSGEHPRQYWPVPLVARTDGTAMRILMSSPEVTLNVPAETDIFLNEGALGFYRVLYDAPTYDRILGRFERLSAPERWLLLEDLFAFLLSGDVSYDRWQAFAEKTVNDTDPLVVRGMCNQLFFLQLPLYSDNEFVAFYKRFHATQLARIGLEARTGESDVTRRLRETLVRGRVPFDEPFAKEMAAKYPDFDRVDPDLRQAVAIAYAQVAGGRAADDLWRRVKAGNDAEQQQMARALGSFLDPALVASTLDRATGGEMPFSQLPWVLFEALDRPSGRPTVWQWLQRDGTRVLEGLAGTSFLHYVYEILVASVGTDDPVPVREFFAAHPVQGAERGIQKGLEYATVFHRLKVQRTGH